MQKTIAIWFLATLLLAACNRGAVSPYPDIDFEQKERAPQVARACGTAFVINGKAYVTLGRNGGLLKDCREYNPENDSWTQKQDFPGAGRVFPISAVVDGMAYVGLGYNNGGVYRELSYLKDFWMYDPVADSWSQKSDYPTHTSNNTTTFVFQHEIYVLHGFGPDTFNGNIFKYNPSTDTWTQLTDFPGYNRTCAVSCTDGNRIFSGTGFATWNENDWWEYLPESDSWSRKKDMPDLGRINGLGFSIDNRFFVATGRHWAGEHTGGHLKSDVMEYDAIRNIWYNRGIIPGGGRENALSFVINDKVYIGFGENELNVLDDLFCFQP